MYVQCHCSRAKVSHVHVLNESISYIIIRIMKTVTFGVWTGIESGGEIPWFIECDQVHTHTHTHHFPNVQCTYYVNGNICRVKDINLICVCIMHGIGFPHKLEWTI